MKRERSADLPQSSPRLMRWFSRYLRRYFRRHFDAVRIAKSGRPSIVDGPLVVYSNHPSWWDPILFSFVSSELMPERRPYGPMDADALEKYPLFRKLGVFGIHRDSHRGAAAFLRASEAILERDDSVLWLTAQGTFCDPRARPVTLQPGLSHLICRNQDVTVIPLAIEYPFWNERLPEILLRFGGPIDFSPVQREDRAAVQDRLATALENTLDTLALDAQTRDPERFDTVLLGATGVGGVYDRWRRWRAARQGRDLELSHEERRR